MGNINYFKNGKMDFKKNLKILNTIAAVLNFFIISAQPNVESAISVSTDFISGGGSVNVISSNPATIQFKPHNEGAGGWGQVWWYFKLEGLTPGEQITLQLDNEPANAGISPQAKFSYDQEVWGLTNTGEHIEIDGKDCFVYKHTVRGEKVWFAYDLPYTPEHVENLLIPGVKRHPGVEVFELCKTKGNRPITAFRFNTGSNSDKKYGIWLQARAHAFETGGSWVLHELTRWLLSDDPAAIALLNCATITVVPIVDVDGVVEGRTGKNQAPYDHNRNWQDSPAYWMETQTIKSMITKMSENNNVDLFIDFHGPGNLSHPYFIVPLSVDLPFEEQRLNRKKFLEVLNSKSLDKKARLSQSMTQIYYSERSNYMDSPEGLSSSKWVAMNANKHTIALTLEVNMNTPLSTFAGYRAEARVLGKAISEYFTNTHHKK